MDEGHYSWFVAFLCGVSPPPPEEKISTLRQYEVIYSLSFEKRSQLVVVACQSVGRTFKALRGMCAVRIER